MKEKEIIKFCRVCKCFSGVTVLDDVCFSVLSGEVHCIVGENGAGKSTLMKIISGIYEISSGEIEYNDQPVCINNPFDAQKLGIATVHQELNVIEHLSIVDNMTLGREVHISGFIDKKANKQRIKKYLDEVEIDLPLETKMKDLTTGQKQMVAIAKALSMDSRVLILDEPTAALSEVEANNLFVRLGELKRKGVTILYISHRMKEIFAIGDRVTVLKDGKYICTKEIRDTNAAELAELMVGRQLKSVFPAINREIGEPVLELKQVSTDKLHNVSLQVRKGEVLGISGIVSSGRTEVLRAIFGADKITDGELILNGQPLKHQNPAISIKNKIGLIPEDRRRQSIINVSSVKENILLLFYRFNHRFGFVRQKAGDVVAQRSVKELNIKLASLSQQIRYLSGGNQQKAVLAKWLCVDSQVLLFDEPTQGIDVGTKEDIYQLINTLALAGKAIIVVSSEIIELLNLCNNIIVMRNGTIAGEFSHDMANEESIIKTAMGVEHHV